MWTFSSFTPTAAAIVVLDQGAGFFLKVRFKEQLREPLHARIEYETPSRREGLSVNDAVLHPDEKSIQLAPCAVRPGLCWRPRLPLITHTAAITSDVR